MTMIKIEDASYQQLLGYATIVLGLDARPGIQTARLVSMIQQATPPNTTEIDIPDDQARDHDLTDGQPAAEQMIAAPADADEIPDGKAGAHYRFDPRVKIVLQEIEDASVSPDVQLSVQGDTITVRRGVEVDMPYRFYLSLRQSMETINKPTGETDQETKMPIYRKVERHTIPHSILSGLPSAAEIAEWEARTGQYSL